MAFTITEREAAAGDKSGTIYELGNDRVRIEVWPFLGFNCLRWQYRDGDAWRDILYTAPDWETNPVPTRAGHPILFPFPNRLRNGRFTFEGREYQLPLNDSSGPNAIHGFTPRNAWRMVEAQRMPDHHSITGEFCLSQDCPGAHECWPADARIRITYRLFEHKLRVEAVIDAADGQPMPFGLGYHPYFNFGGLLAKWKLCCPTNCLWEAEANLPTVRKLPLPPELDFRNERAIGDVTLDTLFGDLALEPAGDGLCEVAILSAKGRKHSIHVDPAFRELLLFTPKHRQAIAIEPYTCITDAANLAANGVDAGWRVLAVGETFAAAVEYRHFANA
jgi:aldose 1-epimerase